LGRGDKGIQNDMSKFADIPGPRMLTTIRSSIIACPVVWHEVGEEWWTFGMVVTNIMFCTTSANRQIKFSSVVLLLSQVQRRAFLLSFLREIWGRSECGMLEWLHKRHFREDL